MKDELSMDKFHVNNNRLYRIMENQFYTNGSIFTFSSTPGPMAPAIKEKYPEIELATRITWGETRLFKFQEKAFYENGRFVDQDFIGMHTFPLVGGEVNTDQILFTNFSVDFEFIDKQRTVQVISLTISQCSLFSSPA